MKLNPVNRERLTSDFLAKGWEIKELHNRELSHVDATTGWIVRDSSVFLVRARIRVPGGNHCYHWIVFSTDIEPIEIVA